MSANNLEIPVIPEIIRNSVPENYQDALLTHVFIINQEPRKTDFYRFIYSGPENAIYNNVLFVLNNGEQRIAF